jgi:hypothetical protein
VIYSRTVPKVSKKSVINNCIIYFLYFRCCCVQLSKIDVELLEALCVHMRTDSNVWFVALGKTSVYCACILPVKL